jgi:hypothetical protein
VIRHIALGGVLAALSVVFTHSLAAIPNVELTSLTLYLGGALLGPGWGGLVGAVSAVALSLTNPLGLPHPVMLGAQVLAYASWGFLGGITGDRLQTTIHGACVGAFGTGLFQLLVNGAIVVATGTTWQAVMIPALPFTGAHIGWNTVAFGVLGIPLTQRVLPLRKRLATP